MKRIISILMMAVLILGVFPFSAAAVQAITSVAVTGLNLPEAGDPLDLNVQIGGSGYSLCDINDPVEWYDVTEAEYLTLGDRFTLNHAYKAIIWLEADSGYEFAYISSNTPNVTATVNGKEATVTKAYGYNAWGAICVEYSFSTCPYDWIESVEATVIPPVAGTPLVHSVTIPANAKYEVQTEEPSISTHYYNFYNGIKWNIEFQNGVTEGTNAQLGKWYCATVLLRPKVGYAFLENGDITATINGEEAQITYQMSDANLLEFSYSGFETFGRIPAFNISVDEPVVGEYPDFHAVAEVANVAIDNDNLKWIDRTANEYMDDCDVFEAGHEYEIRIDINAATGYRFMKNFDSSYVTVNHTAANVGSISTVDEAIRIYKTYIMDSRTPVKQVTATSNRNAIFYEYGRYLVPQFNITAGAPAQITVGRWQYYYPGVWDGDHWVGAEWRDLSSSAQFNCYNEYRLMAQLCIDGADSETYYLMNPTLTVDGVAWEVGAVQTANNVTYAWVTSPAMVPLAQEDAITFTVTYDSRGGSAVPPTTGVHYSYPIRCPADPTRAGYIFKGWYTDSACTHKFYFEGENGMNRIYENITLYAKWEANAPQTNPFTDIKESDYYYNAVLWAVENGITSGTSATTFGPKNTCTRAQVVTFLWNAAGKPEPTIANPFTDVKSTDWYYKAVLWAVENSITSGTSATTFGPKNPCTRAQVVTFLWRAARQPEPQSSENSFSDVSPSAYYYKAVLWAVEEGITSGTGSGKFSPSMTCTRSQVVTFLHRMI